MGTKERLLTLLQENRGAFCSGEEIAETLQVSRTAVWKAAVSLRSAGYTIDAVQNRGYRLDERADILSAEGILSLLEVPMNVEVLPVVSSTNAVMQERAHAGASEGTVILAERQTRGRGRLGRSFYSPPDTGVYLSLLLRPAALPAAEAAHITTLAAVAACRTIEEITGRDPKIKWINDIYLDDKKVCGILTEASVGLECGSLDYAILGAGFNIYPPDGGFPKELTEIAGAILDCQEQGGKNRLTASFLNHFAALWQDGQFRDYAAEYRSRSMIIGQPIIVTQGNRERRAHALDVDRDCKLIVRFEDGTIASLSSAEIRIRKE